MPESTGALLRRRGGQNDRKMRKKTAGRIFSSSNGFFALILVKTAELAPGRLIFRRRCDTINENIDSYENRWFITILATKYLF